MAEQTMQHRKRARLARAWETLRDLGQRGLWPFSADPILPAVHPLGPAGNRCAFLLIGNSAHELRAAQRHLGGTDMSALAIETRGTGLWEGYEVLDVSVARFNAVLTELTANDERDATLLVPQPLWAWLQANDYHAPTGWRVSAGPARLHEVAAFLSQGEAQPESGDGIRPKISDQLIRMAPYAFLLTLAASLLALILTAPL